MFSPLSFRLIEPPAPPLAGMPTRTSTSDPPPRATRSPPLPSAPLIILRDPPSPYSCLCVDSCG
ncbi:hypothetical protein C0Q70_15113 [Pomacea canaliculata]|uniref:Uncharacterized protein n=1 Tax=Pomacea canaliculata TaxID=400727 RepID=A0A2T7NTX6_POMCA|nr:hypothetical protein C0Q70_15113 [Pomacea canaliculata]